MRVFDEYNKLEHRIIAIYKVSLLLLTTRENNKQALFCDTIKYNLVEIIDRLYKGTCFLSGRPFSKRGMGIETRIPLLILDVQVFL